MFLFQMSFIFRHIYSSSNVYCIFHSVFTCVSFFNHLIFSSSSFFCFISDLLFIIIPFLFVHYISFSRSVLSIKYTVCISIVCTNVVVIKSWQLGIVCARYSKPRTVFRKIWDFISRQGSQNLNTALNFGMSSLAFRISTQSWFLSCVLDWN